MADHNNYSLTLWMDGVKMAKSSIATAVPILLDLNELSPHTRKKHNLLAGVWVGNTKPVSYQILKSIVRELQSLYDEGITWTPHESEELVVSSRVYCRLIQMLVIKSLT